MVRSTDFRTEMELADLPPSQQLCYLKRAIPEDGSDLLKHGDVTSVEEAWEQLAKHYQPKRSYTEVQEEFLKIKQKPGEEIDNLAARLMRFTRY